VAGLEISADRGVDRQRAKCRAEGMWLLFFSDQLDEIARARAICGTCTEKAPCLSGAIERREAAGVWGGEIFLNGVILARKRPRGRPRKNDVVAQPA
jgi:WhiB family transcriptional regulator, redox-sensing transcriptional regulator